MATSRSTTKNITVCLNRRTLRNAKLLAAKRNTSISELLAEQLEKLVGEGDAYEQAQRRALAFLEQGFHLGGRLEFARDEWHERSDARRPKRRDVQSEWDGASAPEA